MEVTVVGTSCTWFARLNTSFIIDNSFLFDVPVGNYKEIIKRIDIFKDLKWIFISHLHLDHFIDLYPIVSQITRQVKKRDEKLRIYCDSSLPDKLVEYAKLVNANEIELDEKTLREAIDFIEIHDGMEFIEGEYKVKVYQMDHQDLDSFGLTLTGKEGKTVAFSADTTDCESLRKMVSVSDYAFVDMSGVETTATHLGADKFMEIAKDNKHCKMFPVHTNDTAQEFAKQNGLNVLEDGQILNLE